MEDFVKKINGAAKHDLDILLPTKGQGEPAAEKIVDGKTYEDLSVYKAGTHPPLDTLPQHVQDFIGSLEGMEPYEQLKLIHDYTNSVMRYDLKGMKEDLSRVDASRDALGFANAQSFNDKVQSLNDLLKSGVGDCDDYAHVSLALLHYVGFDPENVAFMGAGTKYRKEMEDGRFTEDDMGGHAVALVKINDGYYVIDMNLEDPALVKTDGGQGFYLEGRSRTDFHIEGREDDLSASSMAYRVEMRPSMIYSAGSEMPYCNLQIFRGMYPEVDLPAPPGLDITGDSPKPDTQTDKVSPPSTQPYQPIAPSI